MNGIIMNCSSGAAHHKFVYSNGMILCELCGKPASDKVLPNNYSRGPEGPWQGNYENKDYYANR